MKKILRLLKRRNNGGFTLIEVIVSCALLAILILAVMGMITPVMSVVVSNENNANALMITEAVEAHIDRNIKNAVYCAVFTNAAANNASYGSKSTDLTGLIASSDALKEMDDFMKADNNKDIYDMKIMGIRWLEDTKTHQYKYMVTNITPKLNDDGSLDVYTLYSAPETRVFEDCFYDNLFPEVSFEVMAYNEHEDGDETKPIISTRNVALKTTINVYSNSGMTAHAAQGKGYADFINIRTKSINPAGDYKLYSIEGGNDAMGDPITVSTQLRTDDELKSTFGVTAHPETYIFYITRKLKFVAPAAP
ncbi:MAG: prepilin-type N-terminal cleavage/methylation domain-containing protein [Ruminococcaceae bacterium]|nr:prepilin-type N-terminal cleavage/methylation domain-containing protein [Oscillospiraceae bacterium]